ncbi:hypothetical protein BY996DRAFT_6476866 [Phakopsora pachyrhizi]|nr:hypothetical protein BY996DRAFT_6476866 [Phakopsora pachyrhizi]
MAPHRLTITLARAGLGLGQAEDWLSRVGVLGQVGAWLSPGHVGQAGAWLGLAGMGPGQVGQAGAWLGFDQPMSGCDFDTEVVQGVMWH